MSTLSLALHRNTEDQIREILRTCLDWMASNAQGAASDVHKYQTVEQWRKNLETRVGAAAFGAAIIPGLHGFGMLAELPYLFHVMGYGAIGTGELAGATIEPEADLLAVLGLWSGAIDKEALVAAGSAVVAANTVAYPVFGAKVLILGLDIGVHVAATGIGGVAGASMTSAAGLAAELFEPALTKISAKVTAKVTAKVGTKAVAGFMPFFGAVINSGISLYVLSEFLDAATDYYEHKVQVGGIESGPARLAS